MKRVSLQTLTATAWLVGFSSLTWFDRTAGYSHTILAQNQSEPTQQRRYPPPPPRIDFAAAAKQLGVTEDRLIDVLGLPAKPPEPPTGDNFPPCPPPPLPLDIRGAAQKLGVTEARLIQILGIPPRPPRDGNLPQNLPQNLPRTSENR